ncbi:MAG: SGNH/GDSL hydrolase family protein [Bacteroidaceae bacterium]|jgi:Lysophospholipase L1 and related esterases|nr:SGNH/GDSL hydrolase family protein [Bacteroidaceae bacterium]
MKKNIFILAIAIGLTTTLCAQTHLPDFTKMNFGCDGNSITSGNQWSATVVKTLGFATHHNVAVGSSTWACHSDTQNYGEDGFAGISDGWLPTNDAAEIQKRHNNTSKVHVQKFIAEVDAGLYPAPDVFVFSMGTNDSRLGSAQEALKDKSLDHVDVTTMAGGARWAIQTIIERFPDCRVFVCTPIQTSDPGHNQQNLQKIEILKEICRSLSVQLIDCYSESGITEKLEDGHGHRYLRDGLHPGPEGQQLMGRYIAKEIRNNYF